MSEVTPGSTLGIVANPMSGRDIRRLVAQASVFPNAEKTNMALRLISASGALGVETVLMSTDTMGVAAGVLRARDKRRSSAGRWPKLDFVEPPMLRGTAQDTRDLVAAMRDAGASSIVVLGGDGTVRAASATCGDVPLLPLSTGTNNAFPEMWEATVAGTAASLLATGRVDLDEATYRAKVLHVTAGDVTEKALVDVCVSTIAHVGSKALWQPGTLRELYCAFAEPHAIGLSSIAGLLSPAGRRDPHGTAIRFAPGRDGTGAAGAPEPDGSDAVGGPDGGGPGVAGAPGERAAGVVVAPIAPGVLATLTVDDAGPLHPGERHVSTVERGTVAVDGERELEFGPSSPVSVELSACGPLVVDVRAALATAARRGLLVTHTAREHV